MRAWQKGLLALVVVAAIAGLLWATDGTILRVFTGGTVEFRSARSTLKTDTGSSRKEEHLYRYRFTEGQTENYAVTINWLVEDPDLGESYDVQFLADITVSVEQVKGHQCLAKVTYNNPSIMFAGMDSESTYTLATTLLRGDSHGFGFSRLVPTEAADAVLADLGDFVLTKGMVDGVVAYCLSSPDRRGQRLAPSATWSNDVTIPPGFAESMLAKTGLTPSGNKSQGSEYKESVEVVDYSPQSDDPTAELDWSVSWPMSTSLREDLAPLLGVQDEDLASYGFSPDELIITYSVDAETDVTGRAVVRLEDSWPRQVSTLFLSNHSYRYEEYSTGLFEPWEMLPFSLKVKLEASLTNIER